eukprot:6214807-Pleurochrysis_carterae.AAC.9
MAHKPFCAATPPCTACAVHANESATAHRTAAVLSVKRPFRRELSNFLSIARHLLADHLSFRASWPCCSRMRPPQAS